MLVSVLLKCSRAYGPSVLAVIAACGGGQGHAGASTGQRNPLAEECATASRAWTLPSASALPTFSMAQTVTIAHPRGENAFRAVLQSEAGELKLIALGPHGGRAFSLTQRGTEVTFENYAGIELPFPPEMILRDVHRVWFAPSALHHADVTSGERVIRRTFEERVASGVCRIVVDYDPPGLADATLRSEAPPSRVVMTDEALGYRVTIAIEDTTVAGGAELTGTAELAP